MDVYFLRHGEALGKPPGGRDEERALSSSGISQLQALASLFRKMHIQADAILSSPFDRAIQTAEIIAQSVLPIGEITILDELASGRPTAATILALMRQHENLKIIFFVGHMPELGDILASLTKSIALSHFRPGTVCGLHMEPPFDGKHGTDVTLLLHPQTALALG